ncbi:MAG: hypothetical protein B7Y39_08585 [Bdellovibrio sp. 28-41-41]|nr:MAG: hypothetical protein B7Y39_08585 [Bdellovibrio sp. 28-41-41]
MKLFLAVVIFFGILDADAFPENVRHGYFSCTACHMSPSGGGVLTPYGRSLSNELMSTWGSTKNSDFLFSSPEDESKIQWLRQQIFLRGVQTYRNTPKVEKAKLVPMQADYEIGVDFEKFAFVSTFGFRSNDSSQDLKEFFSRRHFALYRFTDQVVGRIGKFMQAFGLNGPDHVTATRRGLGWDQGSESYNLEMNYIGESFNHTVTLISNSPQERSVKKDQGISVNSSYFWKNKSRFGLSAYQGRQSDYDRIVFGPYATISITEKLFLNSEFFLQDKTLKNDSSHQKGYATFSRLGYETLKGLTPFVQFDRSYLDSSDRNSQFDSYGVGTQWLPYPHFDIMLFVGKEKVYSQDATDFAWLMFNIYL